MTVRGVRQALAPTITLPGGLGDRVWHGAATVRVSRVLSSTLTGVMLLLGVMSLCLLATSKLAPPFGADFNVYRDAAQRWLAGGAYFYPEQLAGPYTVVNGHVLYPPIALILFAPFTILPAILWWAIPLGILVWRVTDLRPSRWGVVAIVGLACWPYSVELAWAGNPTLWIAAIIALSTRWPWASAFVLLKPSLFPFALAGVRTRAWWAALGVLVAGSMLFLPMWFDWIRAVTNARGPFSGLLYSLKDLSWMAIPSVAWATRRSGMRPAPPRLRAAIPTTDGPPPATLASLNDLSVHL
jgi:hypothetical protein